MNNNNQTYFENFEQPFLTCDGELSYELDFGFTN